MYKECNYNEDKICDGMTNEDRCKGRLLVV